MFPIVAALSCIQTILAWRQVHLDGQKKHNLIVRAAVETLGSLAICTAVIGGFVASAVFATVAPVIFMATIAAKAVFHGAAALYYWGKSVSESNPKKKDEYRMSAKANAVGAVALTLAAVAVQFVMLLAKPLFAIFGLAAGVIGMGYTLYNKYHKKSVNNDAAKERLIPASDQEKPGLTRSAHLERRVGQRNENQAREISNSQVPKIRDRDQQTGPGLFQSDASQQTKIHAGGMLKPKQGQSRFDFEPRPIARSMSFSQ